MTETEFIQKYNELFKELGFKYLDDDYFDDEFINDWCYNSKYFTSLTDNMSNFDVYGSNYNIIFESKNNKFEKLYDDLIIFKELVWPKFLENDK